MLSSLCPIINCALEIAGHCDDCTISARSHFEGFLPLIRSVNTSRWANRYNSIDFWTRIYRCLINNEGLVDSRPKN